jgi:hypothetical protein
MCAGAGFVLAVMLAALRQLGCLTVCFSHPLSVEVLSNSLAAAASMLLDQLSHPWLAFGAAHTGAHACGHCATIGAFLHLIPTNSRLTGLHGNWESDLFCEADFAGNWELQNVEISHRP